MSDILYCLGCGKERGTYQNGQMLSLTCYCRSRIFATKNGWLWNASIVLGNLSFSTCKECNGIEEHTRRTIEGYLGKGMFKTDNERIFELRLKFIEMLKGRIKKDEIMTPKEAYEKGLIK